LTSVFGGLPTYIPHEVSAITLHVINIRKYAGFFMRFLFCYSGDSPLSKNPMLYSVYSSSSENGNYFSGAALETARDCIYSKEENIYET